MEVNWSLVGRNGTGQDRTDYPVCLYLDRRVNVTPICKTFVSRTSGLEACEVSDVVQGHCMRQTEGDIHMQPYINVKVNTDYDRKQYNKKVK